MKSLHIIQILAKIARILCIICFVFAIVGTVGCAVGLIVLPIIQGNVVTQGKTVAEIMAEQGVALPEVYSGMTAGILGCGTLIFLARYNWLFFESEIKVGTPFDMVVVKRMRKVALVNIIVTVAMSVTVASAVAIVQFVNRAQGGFRYNLFSSIGFGIFLLILSLFCEYGAELKKPNPEQPVEAPKEEPSSDQE